MVVISSARRAFLSAVSAVTWPRRATESDEPIRSELFSADRLEQHAESLAAAQPVAEAGWAYYDLAGRARANGEVVLECYNAIASATRDKRAITPAAEWLVDNFHVIDEQLASIARECTPRFSRSLPVLTDGPLRGRPQVYGMVWSFVAHTDSRFDAELLRRFTEAYQRVRPLTIRELWAIPSILRCVLIENLRRLGVRIVNAQMGRREADILADDLQARATLEPLSLDDTLRSIADRPLPRGFVVQLVQRLRYQHTNLAPILVQLNKRLANEGMTWERLIQIEHASQTSANMTVRNLVTSMRSMTAF
ncbi:MAG: glycosyl transferase, partial [Betaproteobacteria bacterium]